MASSEKRIPSQNITRSAPANFAFGTIDEIFLADSLDAIGKLRDLSIYGSSGSFYNAAQGYGGGIIGATGPTGPTLPDKPTLEDIKKLLDIPSLADIESITFEEYPDPLSGIAKYNAIIKIRNSANNKSNISGVDARIYNPNSSNVYNFTPTVVATGSTSTTLTTTATWYNAESRCNPFSGVYGSSPTIVGTALYKSDGSDVPADSISGSSSARIKSVWRKTSAEALEAAKNAACEL